MTALTEDFFARVDTFERKYPIPCTLVDALVWIAERNGNFSLTSPNDVCTRLRIEVRKDDTTHVTEAQWSNALVTSWSNEEYFQKIIAPMVAALHMKMYRHLNPMSE